jgi:hypothetical protein
VYIILAVKCREYQVGSVLVSRVFQRVYFGLYPWRSGFICSNKSQSEQNGR